MQDAGVKSGHGLRFGWLAESLFGLDLGQSGSGWSFFGQRSQPSQRSQRSHCQLFGFMVFFWHEYFNRAKQTFSGVLTRQGAGAALEEGKVRGEF